MHHPGAPWLPCREGDWCHFMSDRFAGSIINAGLPGLYSEGLHGFVVAPAAVRLRCGWSADGSSQGPGNPCPSAESGRRWCTPDASGTRDCCRYGDGGCAWRESQLGEAMTQQHMIGGGYGYNELVFEYSQWTAQLPRSLLGVFVPEGGSIGEARQVHSDFLRAYPEVNATECPLLIYNPSKNARAPFRIA